jgi:hypothetical protein
MGMAKHLPALATALEPTVEFMATGPKKAPPPGATGPTGPGGGTGPTGTGP